MNTHIWETPLPKPHEGEYTLPASMKKQVTMGGQTEQSQPASEGATFHNCNPGMPLNVNQTQLPVETNTQAQYTMPLKCRPAQQQAPPMLTSVESDYTMPAKMKEPSNITTASSDYTIPVLPQPVPDTPDSESEYKMPTRAASPKGKQTISEGQSSLQMIL